MNVNKYTYMLVRLSSLFKVKVYKSITKYKAQGPPSIKSLLICFMPYIVIPFFSDIVGSEVAQIASQLKMAI